MRKLTKFAQESEFVRSLLEKLIDTETSSFDYANTFYQLGFELCEIIKQKHQFSSESKVMLACSSEDADWLSKGILDRLIKDHVHTDLAVFWNYRTDVNDNAELPIAPIIKKYIESSDSPNYLIICKSIISSSCVVKTNLTYLIDAIKPEKILIASPVLLENATEKLKKEFSGAISKKFEFFYFAVDDQLNKSNEVVPGIGGSVYKRLGLEDDTSNKNGYVPNIVKERRLSHSSQ